MPPNTMIVTKTQHFFCQSQLIQASNSRNFANISKMFYSTNQLEISQNAHYDFLFTKQAPSRIAQPIIRQTPPSWANLAEFETKEHELNDEFSGMGHWNSEVPVPSSSSPGSSTSGSPMMMENQYVQFQPQQQQQAYLAPQPVYVDPAYQPPLYRVQSYVSNQTTYYNHGYLTIPVYNHYQVQQKPMMVYDVSQQVQNQSRSTFYDQYAQKIREMVCTEGTLKSNGYPFFESETRVEITNYFDKNRTLWYDDNDSQRLCCRCNSKFDSNKNGEHLCQYHDYGSVIDECMRKVHPCCRTRFGTNAGCKFASRHVSNQLCDNELNNFHKTPSPVGDDDARSKNIFAIDCEMVYTVAGPALGRLTMVQLDGTVALDLIVCPTDEIIDPNTKFSGLTMEMIQQSNETLESARTKMFELVNSETILIGHSLESDFKTLRIVHSKVVDTAILFLNEMNLKTGLKKLAETRLGKIIQSEFGHDSQEDASICIDLIIDFISRTGAY